jgi:hypothetical protein
MEVEYNRDLHHNYMILKEPEGKEVDSYSLKMLKAEGLKGVIPMDRRVIDNRVLYYYDITARQALGVLTARTPLTCDRVKRLFTSLIGIIEKAYEYLLNENDFVLTPETIFLELSSEKPALCYLPGYLRDIKEQMCGLLEYIMNKVDYNDKEAVLLVYNLYAVGKEEGYTFDQLLSVLMTQPSVMRKTRDSHTVKEREPEAGPSEPTAQEGRRKQFKSNFSVQSKEISPVLLTDIPVMMEQVTSEKEIFCYPLKTYLFTAGACLIILLAIILCLFSKILYNTLGNRIDYTKLFAVSLLLLCSGGYVFMKLWDKKNRITRIVTRQEYIDPRKDTIDPAEAPIVRIKERMLPAKNRINPSEPAYKTGQSDVTEAFPGRNSSLPPVTGEENPTCLLSALKPQACCLLKPVEEGKYDMIRIDSLPFFIGKIRQSVDYCLEKDVVSRYHAKITKEQEQYYLTDLNSTNGTFLNGEALPTYQPRELKPGDEISFANIRYQFLIEE